MSATPFSTILRKRWETHWTLSTALLSQTPSQHPNTVHLLVEVCMWHIKAPSRCVVCQNQPHQFFAFRSVLNSLQENCTLRITGSLFHENKAMAYGAGLYVNYATPVSSANAVLISSSIFQFNEAVFGAAQYDEPLSPTLPRKQMF